MAVPVSRCIGRPNPFHGTLDLEKCLIDMVSGLEDVLIEGGASRGRCQGTSLGGRWASAGRGELSVRCPWCARVCTRGKMSPCLQWQRKRRVEDVALGWFVGLET